MLALIMVGFSVGQAWAQAKIANPVRGNWTITLKPSAGGQLAIPFVFNKNGTGTVTTPLALTALVYQESNTTLSLVAEIPMILPDGSDATFIMRCDKDQSTFSNGVAYQITDMPDASSPIGVVFFTATFTGTRD